MTFSLNDNLLNQIENALENQEKVFVVDAEHSILVEKDNCQQTKEEKFYDLPEWTSSDGFNLRQSFVDTVYSPIVHEELQSVLHSGRGVFKNFRLVLKNYPDVEKKWHLYKTKKMYSYINEWYNGLREVWGLEKLDYVPESDSNLLHDDFNFYEYKSEQHKETVILNTSASFKNNLENLPEQIVMAVYEMWLNQFNNSEATQQIGFICQSLSEDFAGCITTSVISKKQEKIVVITNLFVPENFRGLGIATELLSMCFSKLKECGKEWILLPDIIIPQSLQPLLLRTGFEKVGLGYIKQI